MLSFGGRRVNGIDDGRIPKGVLYGELAYGTSVAKRSILHVGDV